MLIISGGEVSSDLCSTGLDVVQIAHGTFLASSDAVGNRPALSADLFSDSPQSGARKTARKLLELIIRGSDVPSKPACIKAIPSRSSTSDLVQYLRFNVATLVVPQHGHKEQQLASA